MAEIKTQRVELWRGVTEFRASKSGVLAGGVVGAALGSLAPVIGSGIGGVVGAALGLILGPKD